MSEEQRNSLVRRRELEKTIETIIKRDTPDREVFFDHKVIADEEGNTKEVRCWAYVQNPKDPFPLVLKSVSFPGWASYEDFLGNLKNELTSSERAVENLYWVDWLYEPYNNSDPDSKVRRQSHFWGKGVKEVVEKIEDSLPVNYSYFIERIEVLSQS